MNRHAFVIKWIVLASIVVAGASVILAIAHRYCVCKTWIGECKAIATDPIAKIVLLFWVVVPPVWFFLEWVFLCPQLPADIRERVAHTHDLARNMWLAFIVLLGAILGFGGLFKFD